MHNRKIEYTVAVASFIAAVVFAFVSLAISEDHEVAAGNCTLVAQFLILTASIFGIDYKLNSYGTTRTQKQQPIGGSDNRSSTPDVEIFADLACTTKPTGKVSKVYARINKPWSGVDSGWSFGNPSNEGDCISCFALDPDDYGTYYEIELWVNFYSTRSEQPFDTGAVIECSCEFPVDVTGFQAEFYKP